MNTKKHNKKNNKYNIYRHHAWAGLGMLSVFFAFKSVFNIPQLYTIIIVIPLICYIIIPLFATYRYKNSLKNNLIINEKRVNNSKNSEDYIQRNSKLEKKRIKTELKSMKKGNKNKKS